MVVTTPKLAGAKTPGFARPADIRAAIDRLRAARHALLETHGPEKLQTMAVAALAAVAREWLNPNSVYRRRMQECSAPFSYEETWPSLQALCESMTEDALWRLIDSERMRGVLGPEIVGHVIAGNTPLLAWTSAVRALLIGSASLLKLPSGCPQVWSWALFESLREHSPELAPLVAPFVWSSEDRDCTRALCEGVDKLVAYGSDRTMAALREEMPPELTLLEYGHRISCAIVVDGVDYGEAATGIAWDIWVYDQGGCLSPQCVFVEGDFNDAVRFGKTLSAALDKLPKKMRTRADAETINTQRLLTRMHEGIILLDGEAWSWTVCVHPGPNFQGNDAPMFVYVVPGHFLGMIQALSLWAERIQGICLCTETMMRREPWIRDLQSMGLSYITEPGKLQCPPLSWRENGYDVLRSLL